MKNEKIIYKHKSLMSHIFILIFLILTVIKVIFRMKNEYVFISRLVCLCICGLVFIISIIKVKNRDLGLLKFLGRGYFFIGLIRFLSIELVYYIKNENLTIVFIKIIAYLELVNIIISLITYYKGYRERFLWINLFVFTVFILKINILPLDNFNTIFIRYDAIIFNQITLSILFFTIILLWKKFKKNKNNDWIIDVSFSLLISNSLLIYSLNVSKDLDFFIWSSKLISYFLLYSKFEEILLSNAYESAYERLNEVKYIKKNLNQNLLRREKELKELNLLLEKSERKYFDVLRTFSSGILIFENDILIYSDYYKKDYCTPSENEENKIYTLNEVLEIITGKSYPKEYKIDEFSAEFKRKEINEEERYLEVFLIKTYNNKKILVFNNITDLVKEREEIKKIEKKLIEQNIKDEFYSNISHELRTPINVIYSALQLNDIYLNNNEISKMESNNNIIKQNCLRLIRTINNFIDSNKLSEDFLEMNCEIYNIVEIIENVVLSCDFYIKLKKNKIIYDPQDEEIYLFCDKNHIERIMLNILSNSLKYGKEYGNIYVKINTLNDEKIVIEVINDAEAIPEDKIKDIFDQFTKINTSLNRPSEGSGLGLYLTKGLVELHNGEISISSGEKNGNIFKIILPYNKNIKDIQDREVSEIEITNLNQKIDIEFSDIYF